MSPTLNPGDQVLVARRRSLRRGDILVARHPYRRDVHVIKRVTEVDAEGSCAVHGDNPAQSTDSRSFGRIPAELILGIVTSVIE